MTNKMDEVQTHKIEFKTGDLIAMDWFREFDGLKQWFDAKGFDKLPSLNEDSGILEHVKLAASLNIVYVFVGNSCPNVYASNGIIAVGDNWRRYDADGNTRYSDDEDSDYNEAQENPPAGFADLGSVCTDLWWVTMLERSHLAEILIAHMGEDHRKEIEEYVADSFDVELQVEPGIYTLHYHATPDSFYDLLDDKTQFAIGTPYCALTKDKA